ncbi:MAG: hypothetical protein HGA85_05355, partial [Nanoarchaeota archaeon]|nr:hypothetical protein [Nanoarchaeota archaeon]
MAGTQFVNYFTPAGFRRLEKHGVEVTSQEDMVAVDQRFRAAHKELGDAASIVSAQAIKGFYLPGTRSIPNATFFVEEPGKEVTLLNPKIVERNFEGRINCLLDGLSIPGIQVIATVEKEITVTADTFINGDYKGIVTATYPYQGTIAMDMACTAFPRIMDSVVPTEFKDALIQNGLWGYHGYRGGIFGERTFYLPEERAEGQLKKGRLPMDQGTTYLILSDPKAETFHMHKTKCPSIYHNIKVHHFPDGDTGVEGAPEGIYLYLHDLPELKAALEDRVAGHKAEEHKAGIGQRAI